MLAETLKTIKNKKMNTPLNPQILHNLDTLNPTEWAWLSGYAWARAQMQETAQISAVSAAPLLPAQSAPARRVLVLSASQTGNARRVGQNLQAALEKSGIAARHVAAGDFKSRSLPEEDIVLLVTSTQGEGEPPEEAVPLLQFLSGKKAPDLSKISFAVLALGDSGYPEFCRAGRDFDGWLEKRGGRRLAQRVDCDVDFQAAAEAWTADIAGKIAALTPAADTAAAVPSAAADLPFNQVFTRENPFNAQLSLRQKITARGAEKNVVHLEIDLADSGIRYRAGDALGVFPENDDALITEILTACRADAAAPVRLKDGREMPLQEALKYHADITQNYPHLVQRYAEICGDADLRAISEDTEKLKNYIAQTPPAAVFAQSAHSVDAQELLDLFRPLAPRLYSIAAAQDEVGAEVHLTVGVVEFDHAGKTYRGAASGFLGERLPEGGTVRVFVEENPQFRLPENPDTPVIMIGAGTGVAPFRAFMQQREADGAAGKNWLIFGNRRMRDDFLYQAEWLAYRKSGLLTRCDTAFSRQNPAQKVYVQQRIRENAAELWQWLEAGAHIYVCGDAQKMARDVDEALCVAIAQQGKMDAEDAREYLNILREEKRYQRDVY